MSIFKRNFRILTMNILHWGNKRHLCFQCLLHNIKHMRSFNKVLLIGNLTKDPEIVDLDSGVKLAKFTLATNKNWNTKEGEKKEQTDFHNVVAWRKLAEICSSYLKKGSAVLIEGKLSTNKYTNKAGEKKIKTEIHADEINFIRYKNNKNIDEINLVAVEAE